MSVSVSDSYQYCAHLSRTRAKNFYYSFLCLPPQKRLSMCAIYAFMRYSDDLSDDESNVPTDRTAQIDQWRAAFRRAMSGDYGDSRVWPAFHDTVKRYQIPERYFEELIDGMVMDLEPRRYERWEDTYGYCYHVASVVGLVCIHVWGFKDPSALELAEANGIAFQLTNILRDLREDAQMGRVYLPQEDLRRFGYTEAELAAGTENEAFRALMRFEVDRAREYYDRAAPLTALLEPDSRPCYEAMRAIYRGILEQIVAANFGVLSHRAKVPTWRKVSIAATAWLQAQRIRAAG
jgi:phytoene synthase